MRIIITLLLILSTTLSVFSQNGLTLGACKEKARSNYPKLKQGEWLSEITRLKKENLDANFLPSIEFKGQATYQSEVIEINIPIPGFEFDPLSNDQYKMFLDVKQTIWDGGKIKASKALEDQYLNVELQRIEVEMTQLYLMIDEYFFGAVMADKSISILKSQADVLKKQKQRLEVAVLEGAVREKDKLKIEIEILMLQQKITEVESQKNSVLAVLSVLIGEEIDSHYGFELPNDQLQDSGSLMRSEYKYFELQQTKIDKYDDLLDAGRKPVLFGFGQAGYGKPGFNMLKNEFDPYFLVGVGVSWKLTDWKTTTRMKEINDQQKAIVSNFISDFDLKQKMQLVEQTEKIEKLNEIIRLDIKLLEGRSKIASAAADELENGSITSTDYLIDLNAETVSKINMEIHKIELIKAVTKYNSVLGY